MSHSKATRHQSTRCLRRLVLPLRQVRPSLKVHVSAGQWQSRASRKSANFLKLQYQFLLARESSHDKQKCGVTLVVHQDRCETNPTRHQSKVDYIRPQRQRYWNVPFSACSCRSASFSDWSPTSSLPAKLTQFVSISQLSLHTQKGGVSFSWGSLF